jgi:hypothetical protein
MTRPGYAFQARPGGGITLVIDEVKLAMVAAIVLLEQLL